MANPRLGGSRHGGVVATPFRRLVICGLVLALAVACRNSPLLGQTNLETNAGVHFNFSTPGAGNLGLGGAFLALAFDASAAYTNPAGLTTIAAPETLVEMRHWKYTHVFTDRGRLSGELDDTPGSFDDIQGLRDGRAENQITGLSYLSFVYPFRDWSFAFYRHELVNFEADFSTQGPYLGVIRGRNEFGIPGTVEGRLAALQNHMTMDIVAYGGAAAYRLGRGFSLGVTVSSFDFSIDSIARRYLPEFSSPADFSSDKLRNIQTQQGEDQDWGLAAGLLWESPRKTWSVGAVYRQGPDFEFQAGSQSRNTPLQFNFRQKAELHVPDVWGVGLAFRPRDAFRMTFDHDRVRYSQLTQGFVDIFNLDTLRRQSPQVLPQDAELNRFVIDDVGELHLGMEYAFLRHRPVVSVRLGAWYEPDHSLRFEGTNAGFQAIFRRRGDQMHYTAGAGLIFRRIQLDAAVDYSDRVSVVSLSAGHRF